MSLEVTRTEHSQTKPDDYFDVENPAVLAAVPESAQRVLDVGCGSGRLGIALKARREQLVVHGIEFDAGAAERAGQRLEKVFRLDLNEALPPLDGPYDCIVCSDVLEHIVDPWTALRGLGEHLASDGVLLASIPNIRYYPVLRDLVWNGRFTYQESGVLDATHLRFFTLHEMKELFERAGLEVVSTQPVVRRKVLKHWNRLLFNRLEPFRALQYLIFGRRPAQR